VFSTGVHYVSGVGPHPGRDGQFGRLLHWLTDGAIRFTDCGNPYDIVRLPDFEFGIEHPEPRYRAALANAFPGHRKEIDRWFDDMHAARVAARTLFTARSLPPMLASGLRWWRGNEIDCWSTRTLAEALADITDPRLRAVLGARWGDYGAPPETAPLLEHAVVTGSYNAGAWYPVGGPSRLAESLVPVVQKAGGDWQMGASVEAITVSDGRVDGVVYRQGGTMHRVQARHVVSTMGVLNTARCLLGTEAGAWRDTVLQFKPGPSYLSLYVGFEGDIAAAGATAANYWIYESADIGRLWRNPDDEPAPALFVSFPTLKDRQTPGQPTAEVIGLCEANAFERWMHLPEQERPEDYRAFKAWVESRLLAQFERYFPALRPMIRFHEMSTPVTQQRYVRAQGGAMYGVEMTAARLSSAALDVRTPMPGLLQAGQDMFGAGVYAAGMSGLLAATVIDPSLLRRVGA